MPKKLLSLAVTALTVAGTVAAGSAAAQMQQNQGPMDMQNLRQEMKQQMQDVMQEVQQRGLEMRVTPTDRVYPGDGFIANTDSGKQVFVKWQGEAPSPNQQIRIVAYPRQMQQADISQYPSELQSFLQNTPMYLEAESFETVQSSSNT